MTRVPAAVEDALAQEQPADKVLPLLAPLQISLDKLLAGLKPPWFPGRGGLTHVFFRLTLKVVPE